MQKIRFSSKSFFEYVDENVLNEVTIFDFEPAEIGEKVIIYEDGERGVRKSVRRMHVELIKCSPSINRVFYRNTYKINLIQRMVNSMEHNLKTDFYEFVNVWCGKKRFEVRFNDRNFKQGDIVILEEINNPVEVYRTIKTEVLHVLPGGEYGIDKDYCVFGFRILDKTESSVKTK